MTNSQFLSISLSAMSAGAALSAIVLCFATSDPNPHVAVAIAGISCLLASISTICVVMSNRNSEEYLNRRHDSTNSWFKDWMSEHDHEESISQIKDNNKMEEIERNITVRMDHMSADISRLEERFANFAAGVERIISPMSENR